jgi:hypothetical protein
VADRPRQGHIGAAAWEALTHGWPDLTVLLADVLQPGVIIHKDHADASNSMGSHFRPPKSWLIAWHNATCAAISSTQAHLLGGDLATETPTTVAELDSHSKQARIYGPRSTHQPTP